MKDGDPAGPGHRYTRFGKSTRTACGQISRVVRVNLQHQWTVNGSLISTFGFRLRQHCHCSANDIV